MYFTLKDNKKWKIVISQIEKVCEAKKLVYMNCLENWNRNWILYGSILNADKVWGLAIFSDIKPEVTKPKSKSVWLCPTACPLPLSLFSINFNFTMSKANACYKEIISLIQGPGLQLLELNTKWWGTFLSHVVFAREVGVVKCFQIFF